MARSGHGSGHSQRHTGHDHLSHWLGQQWEAASLFLPSEDGEGEREAFVQSFPATEVGHFEAWRLADKLTAILRRKKVTATMRVRVQKRTHIGWGVWLVLHKPQ